MYDWSWVGTIQPRRNGSKKFFLKVGTKRKHPRGSSLINGMATSKTHSHIVYKYFWLGELSSDPTAPEICEVSCTFKQEMPSLLDKHTDG
jgi:hypothetical protein